MSIPSVTASSYPAGLSAEWYANPKFCRDACADALPTFSLDVVGIVVEYLKRDSLQYAIGLEDLAKACGGRAVVEAIVGGPVTEFPVPVEIEALFPKTLAEVFGVEFPALPAGKVSDVFTAYFKPQKISISQTLQLASKAGFGVRFESHQTEVHHKLKDVADDDACWIILPDDGLMTGSKLKVPAEFQDAGLPDMFFCMVSRHIHTKQPPVKTIGLEDRVNGVYVGVDLYMEAQPYFSFSITTASELNVSVPMMKIFASATAKAVTVADHTS